jgi:glycosyltransferase involved in cell wall biosynthesis
MKGVKLEFVRDSADARRIIQGASADSIHLTSGFRANGLVGEAQKILRKRGQKYYPIIETIDLGGLRGLLKPQIYRFNLWAQRFSISAILAIGADTPSWTSRLSRSNLKVIPFTYFLSQRQRSLNLAKNDVFRFIFVGSLIQRKRVDLIITSLSRLRDFRFELHVIGDGPLMGDLRRLAEAHLPGRFKFHGVLPISEIDGHVSKADCLLLPSRHDGWGAVVSEALMVGTRAICSSRCGSKEIIAASGAGEIFDTAEQFRDLLKRELQRGPIEPKDRLALAGWSDCISAESGAQYLEEILVNKGPKIPSPPWRRMP